MESIQSEQDERHMANEQDYLNELYEENAMQDKSRIEDEKLITANILMAIHTIDPSAVVAGGAPRDWLRETSCNDIDIFYRSTTDNPIYLKAQLEKALKIHINLSVNSVQDKACMLGFHDNNEVSKIDFRHVAMLTDTHVEDITMTEQYDNSNIIAIFETEIMMFNAEGEDVVLNKRVQFICCKDNSPHKLFKVFDSSINCIAMKFCETFDKTNWHTYRSTLNKAIDKTMLINFSEETFNKGIHENKAYKRFVANGKYGIANERQIIANLLDYHADEYEERHFISNGVPF